MPSRLPKKPTKTTASSDSKQELAKKLVEVYSTVIGNFADRLTEHEALNVACSTVRNLLEEWEMRLGEIDEEGEENE